MGPWRRCPEINRDRCQRDMTRTQDEFRLKLRQQLDFIATSRERFKQGHTAEAVRIAVAMRVIFHNGPTSISLLKHLGVSDVDLVTAVPLLDPDDPHVIQNFCLAPAGIRLRRVLDPARQRTLPFAGWWNEPMWTLLGGECVSRRNLVMTAADQDGGAHVDGKVEPRYLALASGAASFDIQMEGAGLFKFPQGDLHYETIDVIGYEVLSSPELLSVAREVDSPLLP